MMSGYLSKGGWNLLWFSDGVIKRMHQLGDSYRPKVLDDQKFRIFSRSASWGWRKSIQLFLPKRRAMKGAVWTPFKNKTYEGRYRQAYSGGESSQLSMID